MSLEEKVIHYADLYGVSAHEMFLVVECESGFDPSIQSGMYHQGVREESYGLVQIHLPSNPNVSKEEALDPDYALDFMARAFSTGEKGKAKWSCYKNLKAEKKL